MAAKDDLKKFARNLRRGVSETVSKKSMRLYGNYAIKTIVARTRKGRGVSRTGSAERSLRRLSPSYVRFRRKNRFKLDKTTKPSKSNLTFTGQLLRSMRVTFVSDRLVRWGPNKRIRKGGITNERLGEIVAKARPFNNLSRKEIDLLAEFVENQLGSNVKDI